MKRPELLLLALVAVVALAGMYGPTGAKVLVIKGETSTSFDRQLGGTQGLAGGDYQCFQNAEGESVCCFEEAGQWECMSSNGATFGPAKEFREGGQKILAQTSREGIVLG